MSFYERHIFFCVNEREEGQMCCNAAGGGKMLDYTKDRIKALQADGPGKIRVNKAGCLGRCDQGPVAVVYPEGIWYSFVDEEDVNEIIDTHLIKGEVVERLKL